MKKTIKVSRPANGSHTVVTVTLVRNGVTITYAEKTFASSVRVSTASAIKTATRMLEDAEAGIEDTERDEG